MSTERVIERPSQSRLVQWRRRAGSVVVDNFFLRAAQLGGALPQAQPERHGVERLRDLSYRADGLPEHLLDVWRPRERQGLRPALLYVHGGGFRILSKDTHWLFALAFARRGYVVFNINYRLAPRHPFPAAIEDVCDAYRWVIENGERFGADVGRTVIAGESAGANLTAALAVAASYERPEPFARRVFALDVRPVAALPACPMIQVSDPERFARGRKLLTFYLDRLTEVSDAYLHGARVLEQGGLDLADPVAVFERGEVPHRPLPPFWVTCGQGDVLLEDAQRLVDGLSRVNARCEARWYPLMGHAFHAFPLLPSARRHWKDTFDFLDRHVPG